MRDPLRTTRPEEKLLKPPEVIVTTSIRKLMEDANKLTVHTRSNPLFDSSLRYQEVEILLNLQLPKDEYSLAFEYIQRFHSLCELWEDWKCLHGDTLKSRFEFGTSCHSELKTMGDMWVYLIADCEVDN